MLLGPTNEPSYEAQLVHELQSTYLANEALTPAENCAFTAKLYRMIISIALGTSAKEASTNFAKSLQKICPVQVTGQEVLSECQLVLANHQGKNSEGLETQLLPGLLEDNAHTVLKHMLTQMSGIKGAIMRRVILQNNPILFKRPNVAVADIRKQSGTAKEYVSLWREARANAAEAVCNCIEAGKQVLVYPEGTTSVDGTILPLVNDYFRHLVHRFYANAQAAVEPNIGIVTVNSLHAMPAGFRSTPRFRGPIQIDIRKYTPAETVQSQLLALQADESEKNIDSMNIRSAARSLAVDVRATMITAYQQVLETALSERGIPEF